LGTYTHQAAYQTFGDSVAYVQRESIADVFQTVSTEYPYGVIPQENSIFGSVVETYDCLRTARAGSEVYIRGEVTLAVQHCLVGRKGLKQDNIKRILSHEQALGQCKEYLAQHFADAVIERVPSTAAAAQALAEDDPEDLHTAAICSALCATIFDDLEVLQSGIQDRQNNHTRFFVLAHNLDDAPNFPSMTPQLHRALVRVNLANPQPSNSEAAGFEGHAAASYAHNRPLHLVMSTLLTTFGVPAIRIDRRPSLSAVSFEDVYFIEFEELGSPVQVPAPPEKHSDWLERVRKGVARVSAAGGDAAILGVW